MPGVGFGVGVHFNYENRIAQIPGCLLLLDSQFIPQDSGALASWADRSGAGRDAVQANAAQQPTVQIVGGRRAVRFDGSNDVLVGPNLFNGLTAGSAFVVASGASQAEKYLMSSPFNSGSNGFDVRLVASPATGISASVQTNPSGAYTDNPIAFNFPAAGIFLAEYGVDLSLTGNEHHVAVNGGTKQTANAAGSTIRADVGQYLLGAFNSGGLGAAACDMYYVLAFNRVLNDTERAVVLDYISRRFAITLA